MHYKLEVDVHAHWNDIPPIYRLYIDNELFTERTFGWTSYQFFLKEHLHCDLDTGVHKLKLENLDKTARFELENFTVNDTQVSKSYLRVVDNNIEWNFVIDNLLDNFNVKKNDIVIPPEIVEVISYANKGIVQPKKYKTYAPLVQRVRELNSKK